MISMFAVISKPKDLTVFKNAERSVNVSRRMDQDLPIIMNSNLNMIVTVIVTQFQARTEETLTLSAIVRMNAAKSRKSKVMILIKMLKEECHNQLRRS